MTHHFKVLCTTILVTCAGHTFAQGPLFGVKGGFNYATLAANKADDQKARLGFNGGLFARTAPSRPFGLQAELLYSAKGARASYSAFAGLIDQDVDFNLNYLEVPLLASVRIAEIIDLQAGIYAAYLLNAKVSTNGDLGSGNEQLDRDQFNATDLGLAVGAALNVGHNLQLGARYDHGLTKVSNSNASDLVLGDATNRCVQLYLAIGVGGN